MREGERWWETQAKNRSLFAPVEEVGGSKAAVAPKGAGPKAKAKVKVVAGKAGAGPKAKAKAGGGGGGLAGRGRPPKDPRACIDRLLDEMQRSDLTCSKFFGEGWDTVHRNMTRYKTGLDEEEAVAPQGDDLNVMEVQKKRR